MRPLGGGGTVTRKPIDLGLGTVHMGSDGGTESTPEASQRYAPRHGFLPLRAALASIEGVDAESLVITTGASMGLAATLAQVDRPGEVLLPRPFYPSYPGLVRCLGLRALFYPIRRPDGATGEPRLDLEALATAIRRGARAVIVNTPGNPLGNLIRASEMRQLLDVATAHRCLVISDEVYGDFVYDRTADDWCGEGTEPGLVRIKSFSKSFQAPGERIGYVLADRELARRIGQAHWLLAMSPPVPGQIRAAQALAERREARHERLLAQLRSHRDLMAGMLEASAKITFRRPRAGIFCWLEVDVGLDSAEVSQLCLRRAGVQVMPGTVFGVDEPPAIRCSFAVARDELREATGRLVEALETLG